VLRDLIIELKLPKPPTLNTFYAGRHFSVRTKHKKDYWKHIKDSIETYDRWQMESFSIDVIYNCRYDVDNAICCAKFLSDYLKENGYVPDDTPKYFTEQSTKFDPDLEKNQFLARIKCKNVTILEDGPEETI
jgi:hypothetical protein